MPLVVADTTTLNYLILIQETDLLPALFDKVFIPHVVRDELSHDEAPERVRRWIAQPPPWLETLFQNGNSDDHDLADLDEGERAAILLAVRLGAEFLLIDERDGVKVARNRGFAVTGTLGILDLAASRGMIRLNDAIGRLKSTSFRGPPDLYDVLLARHWRR
jgi:predicted nucleic acid-binding protein